MNCLQDSFWIYSLGFIHFPESTHNVGWVMFTLRSTLMIDIDFFVDFSVITSALLSNALYILSNLWTIEELSSAAT